MSRKRGTPKKERYNAVTMEFANPERIDKICFQDNKFRLFSNNVEKIPKKIDWEIGIERKGKNKVIVSAEMPYPSLEVYSVLTKYDYVIAIDTNQKEGYAVSVGKVFRILNTSLERVAFYDEGYIERHFYVNNISSELRALYLLTLAIGRGEIISWKESAKVLIVIDHNLQYINQYNRRVLPLLPDDPESVLPENMRLMYASADKKNDSIFNQWISECDKCATVHLNKLIINNAI